MPNLSRTRCRPISMMRGGAMLRTVCTGLAMERGCPTFLLKRGATVATMWGDPWRIGHRPLGRRKPWDGWVRLRRPTGRRHHALTRPLSGQVATSVGITRMRRRIVSELEESGRRLVRARVGRSSRDEVVRSDKFASPLQSDSDPSGRELARHATCPGRGQGPGCCAQPIRSQMLPSSLQIGSSLHSGPPPEAAW